MEKMFSMISEEEWTLLCLDAEDEAVNAARPSRRRTRKSILRDKAKRGQRSFRAHLRMQPASGRVGDLTHNDWYVQSEQRLSRERFPLTEKEESQTQLILSIERMSDEETRVCLKAALRASFR